MDSAKISVHPRDSVTTTGAVGQSAETGARGNAFLFMISWEAELEFRIGWRTRPTI
jgi:hypothetical protein